MRRKTGYDALMDQGMEMIQFYRENPCIAAYDLLGIDFAPIQRLIFEDMWFKNYIIVVAGRGLGKTFMLGALSTLSCMLYPGYRVGLIAPVFRQSITITNCNNLTFWSSSGLKSSVEEFYDSIVPNITQTQSLNYQNTILSKWQNDDRACRYIKTIKGFELAGTTDHAIMVLDDIFNLNLIYKDLQDLRYNDYIVIKHGFNYFGNNNSMPRFDDFEHNWRTKDCEIPKELTPDLAYWMGLLVGDGCLSISKDKRKQRIDFVNEDQDLLDSFEDLLRKYFLINKNEKIGRDNRKNNTWEIEYYCKKLVHYLLKCGFTKTTALDKKIPDVIKKASREIFIAFLQGLFDTDGGVYIQNNRICTITFNTSSRQLAKEIQSVLLNLGIISNFGISKKSETRQLPQGNKPSKCAEAYKVRITGQEFITKFYNIIGFKCKRKNEILENYLNNHFNREESLARTIGLTQEIINNNFTKCLSFVEQGLYFVKIKKDKYFFAPTIDAEVENEACYWANGFINHNSKMIFSEVEKLYSKSPYLREAAEKKPTNASDRSYLKFKSVGGYNPSYLEALPLADGSKIRGSRFYLIVVDELAQVPDQTLDMVVRPMGATTLEPMENVRRIQRQKKLIELGLAEEDDFEEETVNKMIMTSSGFYKFNHMWRRMKDHWDMMDKDGEASQYKVWQVPYWDLPEGFLDRNNIAEAKRVMSSHEFSMEYEAAMISDSEGFFKASVLEACTNDSGFTLEVRGEPGAEYVVGIDPSQGGDASCGVTIVKAGNPNKIVNVLELKRKTTQELTTMVQAICESYNVIRVFVDKGGGGKAIMDLLEDGYGGYEPIIDRTDGDKRFLKGRHILEMINFNPTWIADANFTTLSMLEDKKLLFPEPPTGTVDVLGKAYENILTLKKQMLNIIVTQTGSGALHFDTPKKGQNKDLYSALILAAHGCRMVAKELEGEPEPILYNKSGYIREHKANASWGILNRQKAIGPSAPTLGSDRGLGHASLKGKKRLK